MEAPAQTGERLIAAFEDLVGQESAAVHADDFAAIESLQQRAGEVGEKLAGLAGEPAVAAQRGRIEALVAQRQESRQVLRQRLADVQNEILRLQVARQCLTRVMPAYGNGGKPAGPSFTAAA